MKINFIDRAGSRNLQTAFAALIDGERLQFNQIAVERFNLLNHTDYYLAIDRADRLHRTFYLFYMRYPEANKCYKLQHSRFPYIECPELATHFKSRENVYFQIERFSYNSLEGYRFTRLSDH